MREEKKKKSIRKSLLTVQYDNEDQESEESAGSKSNKSMMNQSQVTSEHELRQYGKSSFKKWKDNPFESSELVIFSLFCQLNDSGTDFLADWSEIMIILEYIKQKKQTSEQDFIELEKKA